MTKINTNDWIREHVTRETVAMYYTADFGEVMGLYQDGSTAVGQDIGMEIDPDERPVAVVQCPGIGNIDTSFFSEGWTTRVEDGYLTDDGRILSLKEMITESCMEGDISDEMEELVELLLQSFVERGV